MEGGRFEALASQLRKVLWAALMLQLQVLQGLSLNLEGLALLDFKSKVEIDRHGALQNWNPKDPDPCNWAGVHCIDGKVEILDLPRLSLRGTITTELGKLSNLRYLVLCDNKFSGVIPRELGLLTMLELLDLRNNDLVGTIPAEIRNLSSLKQLMLSDNKLQSGAQSVTEFNMISKLKHFRNPIVDLSQRGQWLELKKEYGPGGKHVLYLPSFSKPYILQNVQARHAVSVRRKLLEANNLPAVASVSILPQKAVDVPSIASGSFPAVQLSNVKRPSGFSGQVANPNSAHEIHPINSSATTSNDHNPASSGSLHNWSYLYAVLVAVIFLGCATLFIAWRRQGRSAISPWTTGLSGQLQKAFTAGVPKLNRQELEAACEDFSNIIISQPEYTIFKGTLSNGVEIAVISTVIASANDWSKRSEMRFRKKIDSLCRVNHKNFFNLLGYCEENDPFMRMMVFEYAPSGTLFDYLHVKDYDHLDWGARMRIIMGIAYCLRYIHHELNPPVILSDLQSNSIYVTDDYAAKIADTSIWKEIATKRNLSGDESTNLPDTPFIDAGTNTYSFGILLIEVISGKVPYTEEQGSLLNWATEYLNDKRNMRHLVDPMLKNFKENELDILCEVIQECIHPDPKHRPTMAEIVDKLREVLAISPEAAIPRLNPLWWAELEILSVEAS